MSWRKLAIINVGSILIGLTILFLVAPKLTLAIEQPCEICNEGGTFRCCSSGGGGGGDGGCPADQCMQGDGTCGSCSCFPAGERVSTPEGEKEIEKLKPGDKVKSFNVETGEMKEASVVDIHKRMVQEYNLLKIEGEKEIKVTGSHPILVLNEKGEKEWRKVEETKEGDTAFILAEEEPPDLSDFVGYKIIDKKVFEEDGREYVLLKFDNGKEIKLPAETLLPVKDDKIIFAPQEPKLSSKNNFFKMVLDKFWQVLL